MQKKQFGDIAMNLSKSAIADFVIIVLIVLCSLFSTRTSHSASVSDSSNFMDLQSSIDELLLIVEKISPSVVMIVAYDITGAESARGSGFFIDREGRIVTNALVMKEAYSAEVTSESNYYNEVTILSLNEDLDLALIQVKATDENPLEFDFEYRIRHGKRVVSIGKSIGLEKTVSEGLISAVSNIGKALELIQIETTLPISSFHTSKDGPLLNMTGRVIGVTTSAIPEAQDFFTLPRISDGQELHAVSMRSIKHFLLKPYRAEYLHPPKSRIWYRWFTKWMRTAALNGFLTLYEIGVQKIVSYIIVITILLSLIQWLFRRLKKKLYSG